MRTIWRRQKPKDDSKKFWANEQIRVSEVFLIDENGERVGAMPTAKALGMAREIGLDLIQVDPKGTPPVVKIMDFGQFKYEKDKQAHKQKVQQRKTEIKGIRLSARISQHDFDLRVEQAKKFLGKGDKLKVELALKGRERQHPELAVEIINDFVKKLEQVENFKIMREQDLTRQGGRFNIVVVNKK